MIFARKGERRSGGAAWRRFLKTAAANALLFSIALGLYFALGLRDGGEASAVSAAPLGFTEGLRVNTAVYRGKRGAKAALLIAAGWDASSLEDISSTLLDENLRATFALSLAAIEEKPELAGRLASSGHEIALAAQNGAEGRKREELIKELEQASRLIEAATGEKPRLVYAGRSDELVRAARRLGLIAVKGSVDLICERGSAEEIARRARGNISGGDIVVCAPTSAFSEALSDILQYFSLSGLTAATVSGTIYD